jgi:hypothetical protein
VVDDDPSVHRATQRLWVLLAFDCTATALLVLIPNWGEALGRGLWECRAARSSSVRCWLRFRHSRMFRWRWAMVRSTGSDRSSSAWGQAPSRASAREQE